MNENLNPAWSRLATVMEYAGKIAGQTFSVNAFAHHIGMIRAESIYRIKKGNAGISVTLALKINAAFPMFNVVWLIGATPEPYKFDPSVSLIGKWEHTGILTLDLDTGLWKHNTCADFQLEQWDIPESGVITITVLDEVVDEPDYSFNPANGEFKVSHDTFHIVRLTATEMEYACWEEDISKFVFKRIG